MPASTLPTPGRRSLTYQIGAARIARAAPKHALNRRPDPQIRFKHPKLQTGACQEKSGTAILSGHGRAQTRSRPFGPSIDPLTACGRCALLIPQAMGL